MLPIDALQQRVGGGDNSPLTAFAIGMPCVGLVCLLVAVAYRYMSGGAAGSRAKVSSDHSKWLEMDHETLGGGGKQAIRWNGATESPKVPLAQAAGGRNAVAIWSQYEPASTKLMGAQI